MVNAAVLKTAETVTGFAGSNPAPPAPIFKRTFKWRYTYETNVQIETTKRAAAANSFLQFKG